MVRSVIIRPSLLETMMPTVSSDVTDSLPQTRVTFSAKPATLDTPQFSARCQKAARSTCIPKALCRNIATASSETNFRDAPTWHIPTRRGAGLRRLTCGRFRDTFETPEWHLKTGGSQQLRY